MNDIIEISEGEYRNDLNKMGYIFLILGFITGIIFGFEVGGLFTYLYYLK